ncbi:MAG: OmpA family protein [Proteobacteria bacterium]|nr:OmpA family protein [Pseudomonadota bacterium]
MKGSSSIVIPESGGRGRFAVWFVMAVVISLVVHMFFFEHSKEWKIGGFSPESYDMIVPRTFRMKHVEIDPATLEEPVQQPPETKRELRPIELPPEKPVLETRKTREETTSSVMKEPTLDTEHPIADVNKAGEQGLRLDEKSMNQLLEGSRNAQSLPIDPLKDLAGGTGSSSTMTAFSSLDTLLEGKEMLTSATAPILMPTDLLFGYDSTTLKPEAAKSMEKLGTLIRKNDKARFRIEGHTDAFGTDEYNKSLSLRRAEEVKSWLVRTMGIDPSRITTAGLGKEHLLVPGMGSIDQQQLNRRVEIVITQAGD